MNQRDMFILAEALAMRIAVDPLLPIHMQERNNVADARRLLHEHFAHFEPFALGDAEMKVEQLASRDDGPEPRSPVDQFEWWKERLARKGEG